LPAKGGFWNWLVFSCRYPLELLSCNLLTVIDIFISGVMGSGIGATNLLNVVKALMSSIRLHSGTDRPLLPKVIVTKQRQCEWMR
jgi:hypothetical protein